MPFQSFYGIITLELKLIMHVKINHARKGQLLKFADTILLLDYRETLLPSFSENS